MRSFSSLSLRFLFSSLHSEREGRRESFILFTHKLILFFHESTNPFSSRSLFHCGALRRASAINPQLKKRRKGLLSSFKKRAASIKSFINSTFALRLVLSSPNQTIPRSFHSRCLLWGSIRRQLSFSSSISPLGRADWKRERS